MTLTTHEAAQIVHVELAERSYDILVGTGNLEEIGTRVSAFAPSRVAIVTDETVGRIYLDRVRASLNAAGLASDAVILPPGEATKSFERLTELCNALLDMKLERGDVVIALGGGVIGDLAGFAASVVKRGVRLVQIPTTLLAQVDSSIGGKTGINTRHGKNLIGSFYQPSFVLIDTDVLTSLAQNELRAGYGEVVKYGLLGNAPFYEWLEENGPGLLAGDHAKQIEAIARCCQAKAEIVAEDEKEHGRRALLNLGHTFGHALEAWAGYSAKLLHGEAVSIGMVLAFEMSEEIGLCPNGRSRRITEHLQAAGLPVRVAALAERTGGNLPNADELIGLMAQDKKAKGGKVPFILVREIGDALVTDQLDPDGLKLFLEVRCKV
ncbi:MAG: 3-dehydroquinate synthase [Hyphomicrobiales bacterium]|nr:3-dehydroquinate synthase [Hyphomicrobiales bacterium]